jgi:hypothetical protein
MHDSDRAVVVLDMALDVETVPGWISPAGAGRLRGSVLHKLIEETLTGELAVDSDALNARSLELLGQLLAREAEPAFDLPDSGELATTVRNLLSMADIEALLPFMIAEVAVWERSDTDYLSGRADALVVANDRIAGVIDWKSDVSPTKDVRSKYAAQVADYLRATGALAGAVVFMSSAQIVWVGSREKLFEACGLKPAPA